jgi:hypothetical protein
MNRFEKAEERDINAKSKMCRCDTGCRPGNADEIGIAESIA